MYVSGSIEIIYYKHIYIYIHKEAILIVTVMTTKLMGKYIMIYSKSLINILLYS
jgi:hypothetical protein